MDIHDLHRRLERIERDIDLLFKKSNAAEVAQAAVDEKLASMMSTLAELKDGVNALSLVPAKRYEKIVVSVIAALISAFFGFFLGQYM